MKQIMMGIIIGILIVLNSYIVVAPVWYGSGNDAGLVGKWSCEGNFKDSSGQGNDGTQAGGVTITDGYKGRGCGFDGSNDDLSFGNINAFKTANRTISFWASGRALAPSDSHRMIFSSGHANYYISAYNQKIFLSWSNSTTQRTLDTGIVVDNNVWNQYAIAFNVIGSTVNVSAYKNGALVVSIQNEEGYSSTYGTAFRIGTHSGADYLFNGTIDEFRIYNRSLSATEISSLYNTSKTYKFIMKSTPTKGGMNDTPAPTLSDETGLVGYWKMDDLVNGNTTDSSGQGNTGVINGATFTNNGRWDKGYSFDGSNDNVKITTPIDVRNGTIMFWVYLDNESVTQYNSLLRGGAPSSYPYVSSYNNSPHLMYLYYYNASEVFTYGSWANGYLYEGRWYHVALTVENTAIKLYLNGAYISQVTPVGGLSPNSNWGYFADVGVGGNLLGKLDEARIYNRVLSASEIQELYLSKGLVGYWKMDANPGMLTDSSGYENTLGNNGVHPANEGRFKEAGTYIHTFDYLAPTRQINNTGNITVSAWVNLKSYTPTYGSCIFCTAYMYYGPGAGINGYGLYLGATGNEYTIFKQYGHTSNYLASKATQASLEFNKWYNLVGVMNTTNIMLYIDGILIQSSALNMTDTNNSDFEHRIGNDGQFRLQAFNGSIDEVRIYNRALTSSEVAGLYNGTKSNYFVLKSTPTMGILNDTPAPTIANEAGLMGYWKLDDYTNGNTTDSSGQGNNGSVLGAVFNSGRWGSNGYLFNGSSGHIDTMTYNGLNLTSEGSFSAWVKPSNIPTDGISHGIGRVEFSDGNYISFFKYSNNVLYIHDTAGGTPNAQCSATGLTADKWHHYVGTWKNGSAMSVYLDGVLDCAGSAFVLQPRAMARVKIGMGYNNALWNGSIDEVRVYNRSLNADEVRELYLSKGLVGYWKMDADQKNSTHTYDSSGYYNHGLLVHQPVQTNEGKFKEAYKFDGASDYVQMVNTAPFNITNFTISLWWNGLSAPNWGGPLNNRVAGQNGFQFVNDVSSTTTFRPHLLIWNGLAETAQYNSSETYSMPFGKFKHFVWTYNGTARLWVDGIEKTATTSLITTYPMTGVLIGYGYYPVSGAIDEVRIYNRALSTTEISQLYNGTKSNYLIMRSVAG